MRYFIALCCVLSVEKTANKLESYFTMPVLCRICLQSNITDNKPKDSILVEFHYDLCEKDVFLQADVIFCALCEELLKNFYEFRSKCRYSNEILKKNIIQKNFDSCDISSDILQNENNAPIWTEDKQIENKETKWPEANQNENGETTWPEAQQTKNTEPEWSEDKFTQHDSPKIKIECTENAIINIELKPEIEQEGITFKILDNYYCSEIYNYDDDEDYKPEKKKKRQKKEKVKEKKKYSKEASNKNKLSKETTYKNKPGKVTSGKNNISKEQTSKNKLRDRILELLEQDEFKDLGEGVEIDKDLFLNIFNKSKIGSVRCTMLMQNSDKKEELERLKKFLLHLLKKNNPEYEEMFDIDILDTEELKLQEFSARKLSKEYLDAEYKCEVCYKAFDAQRLLDYHKKWHEPTPGSITCTICLMRFARRKSLAQHLKDNHCAVYRCKLCPLLTYNFSVMVNHFHHHKGKEYSCPVCLSVFSNKSTMNNHRLQAHKTAHICPLCARSFVSEKGLYFHKQLKHKDEVTCELSTCVCNTCGAALGSPQLLDAHVRLTHSALTIHRCFHCKQVFRTLEELRQHKVTSNHQRSPRTALRKPVDNTVVPENSNEKPYCTECQKSFNTRKGYLRHYNSNHNTNRIQKCGFCQAKFTSTEEIEAHRATYNHHPKVRYVKRLISTAKPPRTDTYNKCELCGESVGTGRVRSMYQHFVTSHPDTPYWSVYRRPQSRHLCELCGKTFKDLRFFLDHRNTHSGARPYSCSICARTYATKRHLGWHTARHAPPRRQCKDCGKLFHSAANLFAHTRSHVGDRRFKCDICSKGFLHQAALNEHVRGVHNHIRRPRKCRDK